MSVPRVDGAQQAGVPTLDVKEQNQRPLSQRRTPDTLEGKNASSSCSFRYCLTRIYDFFCTLFRCLFCIKSKPTKPNTEENEQTKSKPTKPNTEENEQNGQAQPPATPHDLAVAFFFDRCHVSVAVLKAAATDFAGLDPKVQDRVLLFMQVYLSPERAYDALKAYLSKECLGEERYAAFVKLGITVSSDDSYRLSKAFEKGFGSTFVSQEPFKSANKEAWDFLSPWIAHVSPGSDSFINALITAKEVFKHKSPEVQDQILQLVTYHGLVTSHGFAPVLNAYLTDECLGAERNQAFLQAYGDEPFSPSTDPERQKKLLEKLLEIFQSGFGSTRPKTPLEQLSAFCSEHPLKEKSTESAFLRLPPTVRHCFLDLIQKNKRYYPTYYLLDKSVSALPSAATTPGPREETPSPAQPDKS